MIYHNFPFSEVNQLSHFDKQFAAYPLYFNELHQYLSNWEGMASAIEGRINSPSNRMAFADILSRQYAENNIKGVELLINQMREERTFAITSAHQPYLFGGPMYMIYKIMSTIKLAHQAAERFPEYRFIPVFYIGGEDHDLEECNHISLFNKEVKWETEQKGPIGRMHCGDLKEVLDQVIEILGQSESAQVIGQWLTESYTPERTVSQALTHFLHKIFEGYPLLVFNPDDLAAKQLFIPIMKTDIFQQASEAKVLAQQEIMIHHHLKPQAFVRPINFFYLSENRRNRINLNNGLYQIVDTDIQFSTEDLAFELDQYPDKFSPNVILRPIYQELIIPSVAFVGGGGELAYWSDRKLLFEFYNIPMPVLVRRDSFLIVDQNSSQRLEKLGISIEDLFLQTHLLTQKVIEKHTDDAVSFEEEKAQLDALVQSMIDKSETIDHSLKEFIAARMSVVGKSIEQVEARVKKALIQKHEIEVNQVQQSQLKLFPNHGLQERHDSLLGYLTRYKDVILPALFDYSDPLNVSFKTIEF